jgi:hypothetical protein
MIPKVPIVRRGFHFEDVTGHQLRQALAGEIREAIEALTRSIYVPGWQDMFYKFADCIEPGTVKTLTRLPYQTVGPNSTTATRIGCVYARLSWCIQLYWSHCFDGMDNVAQLRAYLQSLREIAARGIDKCRMLGSPGQGYWLTT